MQWSFVIRRVLQIIPLMFFVIFGLFVLSRYLPYDAAILSLESQGVDIHGVNGGGITNSILDKERERLGLNNPEFYCTLDFRNTFFPQLEWHGTKNQFHSWLSSVLKLDFGNSRVDGSPSLQKVLLAFTQSLRYTIPAFLLLLILGISGGIYLARGNSGIRNTIEKVLMTLRITPLFWIATLALLFFTTPYYSKFLHWFPTVDVYIDGSGPSYTKYLLPCIILALHSMAYLSIQTKNLYLQTQGKFFVTGLRSRGISELHIGSRHILRNVAISLVTLVTSILPGVFAGSIIVEEIFNIPGIGRLFYDAVLVGDWNVVIPILILFTMATSLAYLLGDLLYVKLDPRLTTI